MSNKILKVKELIAPDIRYSAAKNGKRKKRTRRVCKYYAERNKHRKSDQYNPRKRRKLEQLRQDFEENSESERGRRKIEEPVEMRRLYHDDRGGSDVKTVPASIIQGVYYKKCQTSLIAPDIRYSAAKNGKRKKRTRRVCKYYAEKNKHRKSDQYNPRKRKKLEQLRQDFEENSESKRGRRKIEEPIEMRRLYHDDRGFSDVKTVPASIIQGVYYKKCQTSVDFLKLIAPDIRYSAAINGKRKKRKRRVCKYYAERNKHRKSDQYNPRKRRKLEQLRQDVEENSESKRGRRKIEEPVEMRRLYHDDRGLSDVKTVPASIIQGVYYKKCQTSLITPDIRYSAAKNGKRKKRKRRVCKYYAERNKHRKSDQYNPRKRIKLEQLRQDVEENSESKRGRRKIEEPVEMRRLYHDDRGLSDVKTVPASIIQGVYYKKCQTSVDFLKLIAPDIRYSAAKNGKRKKRKRRVCKYYAERNKHRKSDQYNPRKRRKLEQLRQDVEENSESKRGRRKIEEPVQMRRLYHDDRGLSDVRTVPASIIQGVYYKKCQTSLIAPNIRYSAAKNGKRKKRKRRVCKYYAERNKHRKSDQYNPRKRRKLEQLRQDVEENSESKRGRRKIEEPVEMRRLYHDDRGGSAVKTVPASIIQGVYYKKCQTSVGDSTSHLQQKMSHNIFSKI
ncbi:hypothetical protein HHI36_003536 [Cryptolaemus montrouzieri]|uniref:Uncharacterized protein n=1 Tax=Cryptolaemus montrouzieri TaxID=559131 RepID=A0ABD2PDU8_9CUCU